MILYIYIYIYSNENDCESINGLTFKQFH